MQASLPELRKQLSHLFEQISSLEASTPDHSHHRAPSSMSLETPSAKKSSPPLRGQTSKSQAPKRAAATPAHVESKQPEATAKQAAATAAGVGVVSRKPEATAKQAATTPAGVESKKPEAIAKQAAMTPTGVESKKPEATPKQTAPAPQSKPHVALNIVSDYLDQAYGRSHRSPRDRHASPDDTPKATSPTVAPAPAQDKEQQGSQGNKSKKPEAPPAMDPVEEQLQALRKQIAQQAETIVQLQQNPPQPDPRLAAIQQLSEQAKQQQEAMEALRKQQHAPDTTVKAAPPKSPAPAADPAADKAFFGDDDADVITMPDGVKATRQFTLLQ